MKATGIIRNVDVLGRVTLPIELRRSLSIDGGDPLEIYTEGAAIVLRKHEPNCIFCGSGKKISVFKNKNICDHCRKELAL